MATHATITFSQPGVRPPVYVTSSLSGWTPLEMDVADNTTASGDPVFTKTFSNVDQGSYQYKVRLGQDHWILDESKQTATDDQGIRNNVIHVEPAAPEPSQSSAPDSTPTQATTSSDAPAPPSHEPALKRLDSRKDSTMDQDQLPIPPPDLERDAKQTAKVDSSTEPGVLEPPHAPIVVVDKVDAQPTSAEDATEDATAAQQTAHDTKATDALPDKVEAVPQHHVGPGTGDEQAAPLLHHESSQADPSPLPPSMDTIDEESTPSSADHTSSGDAMDTPSELDEGDELNLVPLLSHETSVGQESNGLANVPLFGHESETGNHHANQVPPLPHESNLPDDAAVTTDSDGGDELDRFPLLEHEGKSSAYKGDEIVAKNHHLGGQGSRLDRPHSNHGESGNYPEGDDGDAPLLPHEREAETADHAGSVSSQDYAPFPTEKQSAFSYETEGAQNLFGGPGRYDFFKTRKNSSLPHRLPRSDAEDEDLNDPSLERFPTNRDLILQRVASIGAELPEDEATHEHPCSPQPSVFSQACSSVDLVPVKSYTSLASVPEADDSDEEDDQHDTHDLDSLPSPIYIGKNHLRVSNPPSGFARDPNATPIINASKQLGDIMQAKDEDSSDHAKEPIGQAKSINGHDGAQDGSKSTNTLRDAISLPTKATASPPMSDLNATTEALHPVPNTDSELRQRKGLAEEPSQDTDAPGTAAKDTTTSKDKVENTVPSLASLHQPEKHSGSPLKLLFGDRKRASASALVIGGALAAYYYMSAKP
ncbi:hypothetical protein COCC4DRAFT_207779 [Bipolaris maydis ATCC 48331]|uniref:AMP-activated protein kinase glycogen-binding domain-containing protein n=2 Tax=Cochliobolus heterostrophus TaxID=5016 RepID=M2TGT5_COCH5|nr:uncharacterized protein COCC4DRAFT_207779 [Bipolaris maydis ATCC 48331]EMD85714.1 hypothetical protein COCHEDRAFT_1187507 [Bipolaris maydis C5]ENH99583.1 hypothetical protein COCC4DRAFT_207779 [Bipolaris maydis ATCC 48331]KAJ6273041.1 hypothetical protein PSV08DRAFT_219902 [Bipolaris maydis]KAJ6284139.1 hypothetical protein J3E71DRAFT_194161 [Bipolaris maydis]